MPRTAAGRGLSELPVLALPWVPGGIQAQGWGLHPPCLLGLQGWKRLTDHLGETSFSLMSDPRLLA